MKTKTELTLRETKIWEALCVAGRPMTINELAADLFARERPLAKRQSRVRNGVRVLVEIGIVARLGGAYEAIQVTEIVGSAA
jgi:hypothetical protein